MADTPRCSAAWLMLGLAGNFAVVCCPMTTSVNPTRDLAIRHSGTVAGAMGQKCRSQAFSARSSEQRPELERPRVICAYRELPP